ncbi:putative ABC transport system ATP-binding protein [Stackebrandtia endophytica]|uniref:Putative ABC transport system ATP-binding protein n=1 Tax=Stackebrandtia endophytica TaxID=1496996 RepID=A0A543AVG1_9ACTN|nr:ATP-binding cassette domain-containing protein [Stackebrandtia endophytica]TQL76557.1 putative ABC transport system ATP-binding protein [Stackebrandtia endophytica]
MTRDDSIVECTGVRYSYLSPADDSPVLRDLDLSVTRGAIVALVGPSGSGKSTLLRLLGCLDRADAGEVRVSGVDTTTASARRRGKLRRHRVGYVRQNPADNLIDHMTVEQHFDMAVAMSRSRVKPRRLLEQLGLAALASHRPRQLSGGEQQRVAIGFAALGRSDLLLLDEPTGQLDHRVGEQVLDTLETLRDSGLTIMVSTHDPLTAQRADLTHRLNEGRVTR